MGERRAEVRKSGLVRAEVHTAIARCKKCGKPTQNVKPPGYSEKPYLPVGHPNSGVVCGIPACTNPAVLWLKLDEERDYQKGSRVFGMHTHTVKIRVQRIPN